MPPYIKFGKTVKYSRDDVERWIAELPRVSRVVVCACMDSGNLTKQFAPIASAFKGRSLCIVPDDDDAGAKAAEAGAGFGFTALPIPKMGGVRDGARL